MKNCYFWKQCPQWINRVFTSPFSFKNPLFFFQNEWKMNWKFHSPFTKKSESFTFPFLFFRSELIHEFNSLNGEWFIELTHHSMNGHRSAKHCLILYSSLDRPLLTAVFSCLQIVPPTNKMKGAKIEIIGKSRQMLQFYWK